ncbi:hypothetical protein BURK1_01445 [Burkholderiales bacterium]|nr:hypothetical protein BURK1_01445 [Burkholderiales bacterium]
MDTAVNLANLARAGYGYGGHKPGLLGTDQLPEMVDPSNVLGTSAHLSDLLGVGDSLPEVGVELLGGLLSPGPKVKAQKVNKRKAIAEALRARSRSLPMDDAARLARAEAQKYDIDWWHGGSQKFDKIDPSKYGNTTGTPAAREAFFATRSIDDAGEFAKNAATGGGSVMRVAAAPNNPKHIQWSKNLPPIRSENGQRFLAGLLMDARAEGHDAVIIANGVVSLSGKNPSELIAILDPGIARDAERAKFDPLHKGLSGLTLGAGGLGLAGLLGYQDDQYR